MSGSRGSYDFPTPFGFPVVYEDAELIPFTAAIGPYYLSWQKGLGRKSGNPEIEVPGGTLLAKIRRSGGKTHRSARSSA